MSELTTDWWLFYRPSPWHDLNGRLEWLYGPERAWEIMEGQDLSSIADLSAWLRLGGRKASCS